jgi:hypothetical protein
VSKVEHSTMHIGVNLGIGLDHAGLPHYHWINADRIVHVEPPPIKVGDMIEYRGLGWTVIGVDGDRLWIKIVGLHVIEYASVRRNEVQKHS